MKGLKNLRAFQNLLYSIRDFTLLGFSGCSCNEPFAEAEGSPGKIKLC